MLVAFSELLWEHQMAVSSANILVLVLWMSFEDLREEVVLSDSSVVVVVVEPEWWEPEALELGARESRLGA
jgi:hypothetical protein